MPVRLYYLDEPLSKRDLQWVTRTLGLAAPPDQIQIPHVLPPISEAAGWASQHIAHVALLRKNLRNAGIVDDAGGQVLFAAPSKMHWYQVLMEAILQETGFFPLLVQTKKQRTAIGTAGPIRIIDTHHLTFGP